MTASGRTVSDVADAMNVDPKTVERWIGADRLPRRSTRSALARLLEVQELYLWPSLEDRAETRSASRAELVEFYPSRSSVPLDLWVAVVEEARDCFDLLAFAGLFLPETVDLPVRVARRARAGVRARILLGDPMSQAVRLRGEEEGLDDGMVHRVRLSHRYFQQVEGTPGLEIRLHGTTLYTSIVRGDDTVLVNTHVYGAPAAQSPVLHLRRVPGGRVFDHYVSSFDRVWATGIVDGGSP